MMRGLTEAGNLVLTKKLSRRSSNIEVNKINSEADKLMKVLFDYARRRREEEVFDFTQLLHEYAKYVLPEFLTAKNNFAKRLNTMIREYVATDPRYQRRLEDFGR